MDWVHCNNCFLVPCADKSFHLTSCGHIFCRDCEEKCARGQCKLCGNQCSAIVLSASMKPDVQKFFTDPDELLKTKIKEVQQVSEFQKNHRARLVGYQRKQLKKFDSIKQDFRKLLKNFKDVESERKRLQHENNVLKKVVRVHQSPKSAEYPNQYSSNHSNAPSHHAHGSHRSNNTISGFINKMDNTANPKYKNQRVSVISPPSNGKMGVIQGTPSPASLLRGLCLNSANASQNRLKNYQQQYSLESSPASQLTQSVFNTPVFPEEAESPADASRSAEMHHRKKMVVHPFSPDTL